MKSIVVAVLMLSSMASANTAPIQYTATRKEDVTDNYHGEKVPDPYRWLEDDNSPETAAWVTAQNKLTFSFLKSIDARPKIAERLKALWNFERFGLPRKDGKRYFFSYNSGLQDQAVMMVADSLDGEPRVLLDPNKLSEDGTVSLNGWSVTDDGNLVAYALSRSGADWLEWHVRDVVTGSDHDDVIKWSKFSGASWAKDNDGFYYSRFDEPKPGEERKGVVEFQKLFFHKLGQPQEKDELIYERRDQKEWGIHAGVTDDGHWLILTITRGTDPKNAVFYRDLTKPGSPVVELLHDFDADYSFIDNEGSIFFFQTDLDAPLGRVIAIDVQKPERANWKEVIPQAKDKLEGTNLVGHQLACTYLQDAHSIVKLYALDEKAARVGDAREISLPGIGSAGGFGGRKGDTETFYSFSSFTSPGSIYRLDLATAKSTLYKTPKVDFDASKYETKQIFAQSKDGTRVPMFVTHRRGLNLDGNQPTLLYGYGGFNINLTPGFSVGNAVWLELGGIYVQANLRGGGEYGEQWHLAGTKLRKQNVFDDFIACAEKLIADGYTQPAKLAIMGGSNGGLLVGAVMTQRPDLFGAAIPAVGVMDMLRFHKFTIGWAWASDYGNSDDAEQFRALYAYSPYHNLKPNTRYPATLVMTADHDDRVVPAHSFKFAARLQEDQVKDGPSVLIRIETKAGHGAGTSLTKVIEEKTDQLAFLTRTLGVK